MANKIVRECGMEFGFYPTDPGCAKKEQFRWNDRHDALVKVGEVDVQKQIDEAARGMSIGEQINRLLRGDTSVLLKDEPIYGDMTGTADLTREEIQAVYHTRVRDDYTALAQDKGLYTDELDAELSVLQQKLDLLKKQKNASPVNEEGEK